MFDKITDFIIGSLTFFQFFTVVNIYEKGIVLRYGKYNRKLDAGFHFIIPFYIEEVLTHETILTTRNLGSQSLTTKDDYKIIVSSIVSYHVSNVKTLLLKVEQAETILEDTVYGVITRHILDNTYEFVISEKFIERILKEIKKKAKKFGITVDNIYFMDLSEIKTIRIISEGGESVIPEE
jgi:regulator of protease activity HflC (stomatin/prohibitin superfamily)